MSKPFDSVLKFLVESRPSAWVKLLGYPSGEAEALDADLSTIAPEADKVIRVNAERPYILHIEFQASYEPEMAERFLMYNVLIGYRTKLPVRTVVILLRREADGPVMREPLAKRLDNDDPYLSFAFRVVRLWQEPVERYLQAGVNVAPLAPLCSARQEELPKIVRRMGEIIEATTDDANAMWTATYLLMGLRYAPSLVQQLLKGVRNMKESSTYQAIVEEGMIEGERRGRLEGEKQGRVEGEKQGRVEGEISAERRLISVLGGKRFGEPDTATLARLAAIANPAELESLALRLLEVESWSELFGEL